MLQLNIHGDNRLPRYQQLADVLRKEVISGDLKPGDRFSSESQLVEKYNVAAGTVRKAVSELVNERLLEKHHGRGTFVRRPNFDQSLFRFFQFRGTSNERVIPESKILDRELEVSDSKISACLNIPEFSAVIHMSRLRLIEARPVLVEDIWLSESKFSKIMEFEPKDLGSLLYPFYDSVCGHIVAYADEVLTAKSASKEEAEKLNVEIGAPLIVIERVAKSFDGSVLEWRKSVGRAEQFQYNVRVS